MNSYLGLCTSFYDTDKPQAPQAELDFYLQYAQAADGPILEPMCGSGRFLVPMLERGIEIDGVDGSPHMLAACREKIAARGLRTDFREQLLHQLDMPRKYGLAFISSGSFNLVTDLAEVRESLKRIHASMKSGAKFVMETGQNKPKDSSSWPWGGRWLKRPDGATMIISWLGRYDAEQSIGFNIHRYELIKAGRLLETEFEEFNMRYYDPAELRALLEEAGFAGVRRLKVFEQRPADDSDQYMIVECTKP